MTGFDGDAHQRYLEAPYVQAAQHEAEFEEFCKAADVDPEAEDAYDLFESHMAEIDADAQAEIDAAEAAMAREAYAEMGELCDRCGGPTVPDRNGAAAEQGWRWCASCRHSVTPKGERLARNTRRLLK